MKINLIRIMLCALSLCLTSNIVDAQQRHADKTRASAGAADTIAVTRDNFVRAESDKIFKRYVDMGGLGKFVHFRKPMAIDQQRMIRMNQDVLYSVGTFDLTTSLTITKPYTGGRFQSMQVVNEDGYTPMVVYEPGNYPLTQDKFGTRYVLVIFRTLVDWNNPANIETVSANHKRIIVKQASMGKFEIPNWDQKSQDKIREALLVGARTMENTTGCYGDEHEVDRTKFLLCAAYRWGGPPTKDAHEINVRPEKNDGKTPYTLVVKDVPVDGFWSISLYNGSGYFQTNKYKAYTINNITAEKNRDRSVTIHFGGDPKQPNYLPIMDSWNYTVRLYRPQMKILRGTWKFPAAQPVK